MEGGLRTVMLKPALSCLHLLNYGALITNLSLSALHAVAFPADTLYYFFRAKCDGSRKHEFAETFDEHLENACQ